MRDVAIVVGLVGFAVVLVAPILYVVASAFRRHDPARARASCDVGADGAFELHVRDALRGAVYFRFAIDGDTDGEYDLVVRGEIVDDGGRKTTFGWRTADRTGVEGARSQTAHAKTTHAVSTSTGSIELAVVPSGACVVRGRVESGTPGLLQRGWVYVPR